MKKAVTVIVTIFFLADCAKAQLFFSDIIMSESDKKFNAGIKTVTANYWRFDTCLYGNNMGSYDTSSSFVRNKTMEKDSLSLF